MRVLALTAVLLVVPASSALADKPAPPISYKLVTDGGRYVFVMLAPLTLDEELQRWNDETKAKIRAIRAVYAKSGLYKNDGSREPLWTVDWYRHGVAVSSDGVHLVRFGPWPVLTSKERPRKVTADDLTQEAMSFFAKGKQLREARIAEVVDRPELLRPTVSHFIWRKSWRLDEPAHQFEVVTNDGNRALFDLRTGKLVRKTRGAGRDAAPR